MNRPCANLEKKTAQNIWRPKRTYKCLDFWAIKKIYHKTIIYQDYWRVGGWKPLYAENPKSKLWTNWICQDSCVFFLTGLPHLHEIQPLENHSFWAQSLENLMLQMKGKIAPLYLFRDDGFLQTVKKKVPLHFQDSSFNSTWTLQPLWAFYA